MIYRAVTHSTTRLSPSQLLHGSTLKTRLSLELESSPVSTEQADLIAKKNVQKCQEKLIRNDRTKERHLTVGEYVRVGGPHLKRYSVTAIENS
ncbi:hypothetical protein A3Q56_06741 [Intoshia linei]|uniref:Uncharacterized protein n=1 Tax=Intoshia linei TaxID=1819745 RepID=A0A177AUP9_9BILA|nr:hypothetical protein A3Q56_06741 [Intoshia linei]